MLTALDVLGYERPTKLRGERARLVGLVLPELQNPIFPAIADVVGAGLAQHGLTAVLCTQSNGGVAESDYVDLLLEQQVAGIVFAGGLYTQADADHSHYERLIRRNVPVVTMNASIDELPFAKVVCDDAIAMEQALEHRLLAGAQANWLRDGDLRPHAVTRKIESAHLVTAQAGRELDAVDGGLQRVLPAEWPGCRDAPARAGSHRAGLRERPVGPRRDQGSAPGPARGARVTCRSSATTTPPSWARWTRH